MFIINACTEMVWQCKVSWQTTLLLVNMDCSVVLVMSFTFSFSFSIDVDHDLLVLLV